VWKLLNTSELLIFDCSLQSCRRLLHNITWIILSRIAAAWLFATQFVLEFFLDNRPYWFISQDQISSCYLSCDVSTAQYLPLLNLINTAFFSKEPVIFIGDKSRSNFISLTGRNFMHCKTFFSHPYNSQLSLLASSSIQRPSSWITAYLNQVWGLHRSKYTKTSYDRPHPSTSPISRHSPPILSSTFLISKNQSS